MGRELKSTVYAFEEASALGFDAPLAPTAPEDDPEAFLEPVQTESVDVLVKGLWTCAALLAFYRLIILTLVTIVGR